MDRESSFVVCLRNEGADDLVIGKVYETVPDNDASITGLLRVRDDSGEDYLYPNEFFSIVELSADAAKALRGSGA